MNENEEQLAFYWKLGTAITQWAHVEHSLSRLLYTADVPARIHCREFWNLSTRGSFQAQLQLVDKTIREQVVDASHLRVWHRLRKRVRNGYAKRNGLAHFTLVGFQGQPGRRMGLVSWKQPIGNVAPSEAICVRNLVGSAQTFFALAISIDNLEHSIRGVPKTYPVDLEIPGPTPSLKAVQTDLLGLIRAAGYAKSPVP